LLVAIVGSFPVGVDRSQAQAVNTEGKSKKLVAAGVATPADGVTGAQHLAATDAEAEQPRPQELRVSTGDPSSS
jgi:hypothetical protein